MSKLWILAIVALIGGAIYTGIIEINVNTGSLGSLSGVTNEIMKEKTAFEQARAYFVNLKRRSELFIVRDKEKRLVLSLLYVKTDAQRLQQIIDEGGQAQNVLPQAELLVTSLQRVRKNASEAPVEVVASLKADSARTFATAQKALGGLQEEREEYEEINQEFARLTESLEQQIGELGLDEQGNVAGEQDAKSSDAEETSPVPLQF